MAKRMWEVAAFVALSGAVLWAGGLLGPLKQEGKRVAQRVVHGDPLTRETVTHGVAFAPGENATVTVTGGGMEVERVAQTKTQVVDGVAAGKVTGVLKALNIDKAPGGISTSLSKITAGAGNIIVGYEDLSTAPWWGPDPQPREREPGFEWVYRFVRYVWSQGAAGLTTAVMDHDFVYFFAEDATPWNIELEYEIYVGGARRIWREESTSYGTGRHGKPVYAKEVTEKDQWQEEGKPWTYYGRLGPLEISGTQTEEEVPPGGDPWNPTLTPMTAWVMSVHMHKGDDETKYAEVSVEWDDNPVDFTGGYKVFGTIYKIIGNGSALECWVPGTGGVSDADHGVDVNRPLMVDFSEFYIRNRLGAVVGDNTLRIDGPFICTPRHAASTGWAKNPNGTGVPAYGDKAYPTPAQLRAVGTFVEGPSRITGLDYDDADWQRELVNSNIIHLTKTPESLRIG